MGEYGGYAGAILEIDLTTQGVSRIPLPAAYRERLLGGKALAAQLLCRCMTGKETAMSGENPVVIAAAPLAGSGAPGSRRFDLVSLSAKDDRPVFSNCGGDFGILLKKAGYDAVILKGCCHGPCWLEITEETVRFHDAQDLWGMGTGVCRNYLREKTSDRNIAALCIGPAGEHLVKYASVLADGHSLGRAGLGAVLGWKKLKAITVSGRQKIPLAQEASVTEQNRLWYAQMQEQAMKSEGEGNCPACPLHCPRHGRGADPVLDELGMDAMEAEAAFRWAQEQGMDTAGLYEAIAFRRGIGDRLAEGVDAHKRKGGSRRKGNYGQIALAFDLPPEAETTAAFCRNYAEAVSVCGQCMFTVKALDPGQKAQPLLNMMECVTGQIMELERLLSLGAASRHLEQTLRQRFEA